MVVVAVVPDIGVPDCPLMQLTPKLVAPVNMSPLQGFVTDCPLEVAALELDVVEAPVAPTAADLGVSQVSMSEPSVEN